MSGPKGEKRAGKAGRPPTITEEVTERIANLIRGGAYLEQAAIIAGVPRQTLYDWIRRGREHPESIYARFSYTIERAIAECEMRDVQVIDAFAQGRPARVNENGEVVEEPIKRNPNWAAWRLERRFPSRWGGRTAWI